MGIGLEIMTLLLPHLFLPLGATANLMKGLAWSAGGASRAAIHFSFSKMMNMGDSKCTHVEISFIYVIINNLPITFKLK